MTSVFVHGFLGLPSDWDDLQIAQNTNSKFRSLWNDLNNLGDKITFSTWADYFLATSPTGIKAYGYSLGGRLLLHAYLKKPSHFSSLHLFSTNYGLQNELEKKNRLQNDLRWAERFLSDPWDALITSWNAQPVFTGSSKSFVRNESDFNRELLAKSLDAFSLGRQEYLLPQLESSKVPIHFIMGENDTKFMTLLNAISPKKNIFTHAIPGVGHRIPWEYRVSGKENWL
ncbi:MAG: hypothetical protein KDD37_10755 [Bdellovibrionales bacterium]|nr:hypothetical protein [Bdellovibrionales bacterium]